MRVIKPEQPNPKDLSHYPEELLTEMYRRMYLIRNFELKVNDLFLRGIMPGTIHLSHGQEATTVGTCLALVEKDVVGPAVVARRGGLVSGFRSGDRSLSL